MTTPQAQLPASAGARVVGIPELLEQILLKLIEVPSSDAEEELKEKFEDGTVGLQTVLLSQRTSQAFRDTVIGSPAIQRALFGEDAKPAVDGYPKANPLLDHCVIGYGLPESSPFRVNIYPVYDLTQPNSTGLAHRGYVVRLHRMYSTRNRIDMRKRQGVDVRASWRQMHLLSETGSTPIIQLVLKWVSGKSILDGQWDNPTLGEVFDLLHGTKATP
ncbi:hypothetical protein AC579_4663 [Pseudocercospora musae]|uniref:Uncharacterized protein n=1 Tax=Pseudocercospora musae TaxID=113226 RepID=A0A139IB93_9PEZI|nr:hypothetical protein AC579_4663 [Pseudocercospora musae]